MFCIIFWIISQNFDQMITLWHSGHGDTPLGIYLLKNILMLKSIPLIFRFAKKLPVFDKHVLITKPDGTFHMEKKKMQYYEKENHLINKIHLSQ